MPIYEYICKTCTAEFNKLQKINDLPLTKCENCGKDTLTKLVSAANFRLKGKGWYETDFKTDKDKKHNLAATDNTNNTKPKIETKNTTPKKTDSTPNNSTSTAKATPKSDSTPPKSK